LLSHSGDRIAAIPTGKPERYISGHILDFVRSVVSDADARHVEAKNSSVFESLRQLLQTIERSKLASDFPFPQVNEQQKSGGSMSPLDAAVAVLRWAKVITVSSPLRLTGNLIISLDI
jgi:hypothetical protein